MKNKVILDLCGGTGAWSKPYKDAGYAVINATLPEIDVTRTVIENKMIFFHNSHGANTNREEISRIYGILAAPPCTKFSKAASHVSKKDRDFKTGMKTVRACLNIIWAIQENGVGLKFWALENPMGYLYNFLGFPYFYFQPWQFGETSFLATKRTALWGYFNKPIKTVLKRTIPFISPYSRKDGYAFDRSRNNQGFVSASQEARAITPAGFAQAFMEANL